MTKTIDEIIDNQDYLDEFWATLTTSARRKRVMANPRWAAELLEILMENKQLLIEHGLRQRKSGDTILEAVGYKEEAHGHGRSAGA
jgi:hypothetical protein